MFLCVDGESETEVELLSEVVFIIYINKSLSSPAPAARPANTEPPPPQGPAEPPTAEAIKSLTWTQPGKSREREKEREREERERGRVEREALQEGKVR